MFQVIFIFSDWILIKQIIVSFSHFYCWGKQIFGRMLSRMIFERMLFWKNELCFMTLKSNTKFDLWFGKWHEEFGKFLPEHSKVSRLGLWWDPFIQSRKCMSLKIYRGVTYHENEERCKIWREIRKKSRKLACTSNKQVIL